ncbi:MAG: hypothetical protein ACREVW_15815 [Burkholderiales bacterium]
MSRNPLSVMLLAAEAVMGQGNPAGINVWHSPAPTILAAVIVAAPALFVDPTRVTEQLREAVPITTVTPPARVNAVLTGERLAALADETKHSPSIAPRSSFDVRIILVPHEVGGWRNRAADIDGMGIMPSCTDAAMYFMVASIRWLVVFSALLKPKSKAADSALCAATALGDVAESGGFLNSLTRINQADPALPDCKHLVPRSIFESIENIRQFRCALDLFTL